MAKSRRHSERNEIDRIERGFTYDYDRFILSDENRVRNENSHKWLENDMKQFGYKPWCWTDCSKLIGNQLLLHDGQHRLYFAEKLKTGVSFQIIPDDLLEKYGYDVATDNASIQKWKIEDYVKRHIYHGNEEYVKAAEFCNDYKLPYGVGFKLLAGGQENTSRLIKSGRFVIRDEDFALQVMDLFWPLKEIEPKIQNQPIIIACKRAVKFARYKNLDLSRLQKGILEYHDRFVTHGKAEHYTELFEQAYNAGKKGFNQKSFSIEMNHIDKYVSKLEKIRSNKEQEDIEDEEEEEE